MLSSAKELGTDINLHVHRVCAFGSTNLGDSRKADRENIKYMKALHNILVGAASATMKKIEQNVDKKQLPATKKLLEKMRKKVRMVNIAGLSAQGIFKEGEECAMLPLKNAISPRIMEIVNIVYPYDKNFDTSLLKESDFYSVYASILSSEATMAYCESRQGDRFFQADALGEFLYTKILAADGNFNTENLKKLFIKSIIRFVKNGAYFHGTGNCELMADTALLEAIFKPHDFNIHYVRFTRDVGEVDVINCIVLGDWPNPGCQIIVPWYSEDKRVFTWQGSIEATPEIKNNNQHYNCFKEIAHFSVAEKEKFKKQLDEMGYSHWMESPTREENFRTIRDFSTQFLTGVTPILKNDSSLKQSNSRLQQ